MSLFNDRRKLFFGAILIVAIIGVQSEDRGFLLTIPNTLHSNTNETMCMSFHNIHEDGRISVKLVANDFLIASTSTSISHGQNTCFEIVIPKTSSISGIIKVYGYFITPYFQPFYEFREESSVTISSNSVMTFIETDKKVYKHGQKVLFRILRLTNTLMPVLDPISEVWIENPSGVRLGQWRNPQIENGLTDLAFELSDEPPLGEWSICLENMSGNKETQTFDVKEYVLPTFEITLDIPSVLFVGFGGSFRLKVCAHYTYGQPVNGILHVQAKLDSANTNVYQSYFFPNSSFNLIRGCHEMSVLQSYFTNDGNMTFSMLSDDLKILYTSMTFFAEVIEDGTGLKINKTKSQELFKERFQFEFKSKPYFKPNMPYYGKILVQQRNGNPAINEEFVLTVKYNEKIHLTNTLTSNHLGEVDFVFETKENQEYHISLQEYSPGLFKTSVINKSVKSWYSPAQRYLQVGPVNGKFGCDRRYFDLLVNFTVADNVYNEMITLYYQVMTRGRLLLNQKKVHYYDKFSKVSIDGVVTESITLPINIISQMSPLTHILVYYVGKDYEIVSDDMEIAMENCFENNVRVSFDKDEILPSTTSVIDIFAHPHSMCALSVVDKSAHLLASENFLSIDKVFSVIGKTYPKKVTTSKIKQTCHNYHQNGNKDNYVKTDMAFNDAGLVTISNLHFKSPPCPPKPTTTPRPIRQFPRWYFDGDIFGDGYGGNKPLTKPFYNNHECGENDDDSDESDSEETQDDVMLSHGQYPSMEFDNFQNVFGEPEVPDESPNVPHQSTEIHQELPEVLVEPPPRVIKSPVEIRDYFPETWLWELHHVGSKGRIQLKREIPHSITTWIGTAFCLSEEKGLGISQPDSVRGFQAFFLSYTMPFSIKNEEVAPVIVTIFNYVSECIPIRIFIESSDKFTLVSNFSSTHACLCDLPHTHKFWIRPTFIGSINVTVYAHSVENTHSEICKNENKVANVIASDAATHQILVKAQGFPREFSNTFWICPSRLVERKFSREFDLLLPRDLIKGSERATVSIIGDLMGPTIQGLESLIKLPVGCGEQNMILFAPNIYVLQYLTNSNLLTDDLKEHAIKHLRIGYQRQLNYKHDDGSYSAFGKRDSSGSIWLTAFVLKSFAQAKPFVYIDLQELKNCEAFIFRNQLPNGSFISRGNVLQKEMQGGIGSKTSDQSLAAYILISLLEAGSEPNSSRINQIFDFLLSHNSTADNTYLLAMKAYAATLATRNTLASLYINQLYQRATRKADILYWTQGNSHDSQAINIEITSYALLTLITQNAENSKRDAVSIVRWLTEQRNAYGGFVSTQDTILALQALAKFAAFVQFANGSLEVTLDSLDMENVKLQINNENKLVQQSKKLPVLPTHLDVNITGHGCVMFQYTMKYNVLNNEPTNAFNLEVFVTSVPKTCSVKQLEICTSYKLADGHSNMAVIEVQMISGFEADPHSLDVLQNSIDVQLKRWEVSPEGYINLYFDELTHTKKCFNFNVIEKFVVHERQPAIVKAYDYYEPELIVSSTYSFSVETFCIEGLETNGTIF